MTSVTGRVSWELPLSFRQLLDLPLEQAINQCLPTSNLTATKPTPAPQAVDLPPFLKMLQIIPDAVTENGAAAYSTKTGSPLVNLFYDITPGVDAKTLFSNLDKAWATDPESTLRIILQTRSIHEGKGFKQGFFTCVSWLFEHHPRTLLANLNLIVAPTCERHRPAKDTTETSTSETTDSSEPTAGSTTSDSKPENPLRPHGSFDDLVDILVLAVNGQLGTKYTGPLNAMKEALAPASAGKIFAERRKAASGSERGLSRTSPYSAASKITRNRLKAEEDGGKGTFAGKLMVCGSRQGRATVIATRCDEFLTTDAKSQALYLTVVDIFVKYLQADLESLEKHNEYLRLPKAQRRAEGYGKPGTSPHQYRMSYAAKWAPTPGKSADKQLRLATALAHKMFPTAETTRAAREALQTRVLAPLRRILNVTETKMVHGKWKIDYSLVPSLTMARHQTDFLEHDHDGFTKYLADVASGKKTISGASMMPHKLLHDALRYNGVRSKVADLQWKTLVASIRSSSDKKLSNCIAVADVSGSMGSINYSISESPIFPCIALSLLLSELSQPPWNGSVITFSSQPKVEHLDPNLPLSGRAKSMERLHWEMSTDYTKVFTLLLEVAKQSQLPPDEMIKKIFVFSDMQFDSSQSYHGGGFGPTEHQVVANRFKAAGYPMPEIVYWNLQSTATKPVQSETPGVALVSGFSGALMKYFIKAMGDEDENEDEDEDEAEWDMVDSDGEARDEDGVTVPKPEAEKRKKDPMDHLRAIIGAKSFDGVVVVD